MFAQIMLLGSGVLKATAHTKLLNFGSSFGAFVVFATNGSVLWQLGLCLALAQVVGTQIGSRIAVKVGIALIKPLLVVTSLALALRLLWNPDHPLWIWLGQ